MARKKTKRKTARRSRRRPITKAWLARLRRKLARIGSGPRKRRRRRPFRNVGHFAINFSEANRVRRMKGRKPLTRGQYRYRVGRNLPVTI